MKSAIPFLNIPSSIPLEQAAAMPRPRVRPDPALCTPLATPARPLLALVPVSDRHDYYAQRQAFLRSYTLSARESLGERLRRRWREIVDRGREALWNAAGWVFDEFSKRKREILSALRWRMPGVPALHRVGCFGARQRRPEFLLRNFF